jgi:hypothetical protein
MPDQTLRTKLLRLAHENPDLRPHLLPLLKQSGKKQAAAISYANLLKEHVLELIKTLRYPWQELEARRHFMSVLGACGGIARFGFKDPVLFKLIEKARDHLETSIYNDLAGMGGEYSDEYEYGGETEPPEVRFGPKDPGF